MRETKDFKFSLVGQMSDEGCFTGHASVFNGIDSFRDMVEPGAFKKTLKENKQFPLLFSHDTMQPIGIIRGEEDGKGLAVEGDLNMEVASAREKRALVKQGALKGLSIGYESVPGKDDYDPVEKVRHLREIKLWEVSLVVFHADKNARIAQIKGIPYTDFHALMDYINELDVKEIEPRFQEAAKRAADRIYALLKVNDNEQPPLVKQPDFGPLQAAFESLNRNLTGGK